MRRWAPLLGVVAALTAAGAALADTAPDVDETAPADARTDEAPTGEPAADGSANDAPTPAGDAAPTDDAPAADDNAPAADEATGPLQFRLIVLDLKARGVPADEVATLGGLITVTLGDYPALDVVSGADVRELVKLEGEKQALGCDDTSCLAEIAGALGARLVVFGDVGKVGSRYVLNLNLFDSENARSEGRAALTGRSLDDIVEQVDGAVYKLVAGFLREQGVEVTRTAPSVTTTPDHDDGATTDAAESEDTGPTSYTWLTWTGAGLLGVGAAATVASSVGLFVAFNAGDSPPNPLLNRALIMPAGLAGVVVVSLLSGEPFSANDETLLVLALAGVSAIPPLLAVGGAVALSAGVALDSPPVTPLGHAWRWGLIGGGALVLTGGYLLDNVSPGMFELLAGGEPDGLRGPAWDHAITPLDVVPVALYAIGGAMAITGLVFNPFPAPVEEAKEGASLEEDAE